MKRFLIEVADGKGENGVFLVEHRGRALIVADRAQRRAVEATAGSERGADSLCREPSWLENIELGTDKLTGFHAALSNGGVGSNIQAK